MIFVYFRGGGNFIGIVFVYIVMLVGVVDVVEKIRKLLVLFFSVGLCECGYGSVCVVVVYLMVC